MESYELKVLRQLFFFTISEAAEHISKTSKRSWERYESGDQVIHLDVIQTMQQLALTRHEMLMFENDKDDPNYQYHNTYEEYKTNGGGGGVIRWRLAQSVSAQLTSYHHAHLWQLEETINGSE